MMSDPDILIISTVADIATDDVIRCLDDCGVQARRVNTEDYPLDSMFTLDYQHSCGPMLDIQGTTSAPRTIWYRRVRSPVRPESMDVGIYDFCLRENRAAFLGGLLTQRARWMNHPVAVWRAEFKPYQLRVAMEVGLRIPKTIVSNDPDKVRQAYADFNSLIVKPARSGHFWQAGEEFSVFTSQVTAAHLDALDDARWAPSVYQELIPKRYDVRATCVGSRIFAAAIHSQTDAAAEVDWRRTTDPALPHSTIDLPTSVLDLLRELMGRLELDFGCIDLVLTPEGEYVFLEVNPSGQWLWLDDQLDLGISQAIADWLVAA